MGNLPIANEQNLVATTFVLQGLHIGGCAMLKAHYEFWSSDFWSSHFWPCEFWSSDKETMLKAI